MKFNIRNKLVIFAALLIFAPLALSALAFVVVVSGTIDANARRDVEKDARLADRILRSRQQTLREVAQATAQAVAAENLIDSAASPTGASSASGNPAQVAQQSQASGQQKLIQLIKQRVESSGVDFIAILNTKGQVLVRSAGSGEDSFSDNPLFIKAKNAAESNQPDALLRALVAGSVNETPDLLKNFGLAEQFNRNAVSQVGLMIEAIAPVVSGNRALGYVVTGQLINNAPQDENRPLAALTREVKQTLYRDLQEVAVSLVLAKDKKVISASDPRALGLTVQSELAADKPTAVNNPLLGASYKTAFAPVKGPDDVTIIGYVGVGVRESYFSQVFNATLLIIAVVTGVSLVLGVGVAFVLSQRLTQPILKLTDAANRISLGELDEPISVATGDEIGELGESLERMRISLKQAIERLRSRR
ncbi:MAG: HAMP domain-containing protein [Chloracidobacterium sp.]|uniref:histidine kinase n=1 Tax=Chloracidobacterium validum TaxID=2821543 RepID=A0ABX8B945_9BACT|nr:HAMP domain-containing protein [Chloracidobacterium validum]QUW02158.1 HAMP domain-containing protein [Chloracidobacterium validum]